jgi:RNA polymerase sigma factor (sigma-70 family)
MPDAMTDEQVVDRVRGGEPRLFAELVARHQDAVHATALRLLGDASDAEDTAQEAFLKAFRGLEGFRGDAKFSTWLYRITVNLCADHARRRRRPDRRTHSIDVAGELPDGRMDTEGGLLASEERRAVERAVLGLEERYRSIVVLHYYQKLSYEEIATVLGMPLKTVETRLYRARRMLRDVLGPGRAEGAEP